MPPSRVNAAPSTPISGPVRYLATLIGTGDQDVLRWFILVIAVLLDPAAVLLLLAATRAGPLSSAAAGAPQ